MTRTTPTVLTVRARNRALLARQLLLERASMSPARAIEHLVGLQAQVPNAPYLALWSRLRGFTIPSLARLVAARQVVRIVVMRSTIHLVTARECLSLRALTQPVLKRSLLSSRRRLLEGLDVERVAAEGRRLTTGQALTFAALGAQLAQQWRGRDPEALAQLVRAHVPLVQVPPRGMWGTSGPPAHETAESWIGAGRARVLTVDQLVIRYLRAFGPASVADMATWSGLTRLREVFERLAPRLRTFRSEDGTELFDVPGAPRPGPEVPAPPRFLPEFDTVLLGHADRALVVGDQRRLLFAGAGLLLGTFLLDGFVAGRWRVTVQRRKAWLTIEPATPGRGAGRTALAEEGERLLALVAPDVDARDVRLATRR